MNHETLQAQGPVDVNVRPYAWHYRNNGGASVWHMGPSARFDADAAVCAEFPRAHSMTALYDKEALYSAIDAERKRLASVLESMAEWAPCDCGCGGESPKDARSAAWLRAASIVRCGSNASAKGPGGSLPGPA